MQTKDTASEKFIRVCAPYQYSPSFRSLILRDAPTLMPWESFDAAALRSYILSGTKTFADKVLQAGDLSSPYSSEQGTQLIFMAESLVHARILLEELKMN